MKKIFNIKSIFVGGKGIFSNGPRKPKIKVPITYTIGWWSHQDDLTIEGVDVEIIESKLNLFTAKSLLSYTIYGKIKINGPWEPKIKSVHLSERMEQISLHSRIIEITPIVSVTENTKLNSDVKNFSFKNEHTINSTGWGNNRIKFLCGNKEKIINLHQSK